MKQLPFILVLLLSSGLMFWNFQSYDTVHASDVPAGTAGADSAGDVRFALAPGVRPAGAEALVRARSSAGDMMAQRASVDSPRISLSTQALDEQPAEVAVAEPEPPQEPDPAAPETEHVLFRSADGRVRAEGTSVDGKKHGRWVEWWGLDQPLSDGHYVNGERQGPWIYWHENGEVKEQGSYKDDLPDGVWSWNYPDGSLRLTQTLSEGRNHGPLHEWATDGSSLREGSFVDGEADGRWVESHPDGTPRSETYYLNGMRHGLHRAWYTNGQIKEQGEYRAGLREGRWLFFDPQGRQDELRSGYYELGRRNRS